MPPEPSVTSASEALRRCTLRYSSALLPKSFERPGPKSVSPAMNCSGVDVVVWCIWIVDMQAPCESDNWSIWVTAGLLDESVDRYLRRVCLVAAPLAFAR